MGRRNLPRSAKIALLALAYLATARAGLSLAAIGGLAAPVWPPTGMAVAAMLLAPALWPGIALGAFLTNLSIGVPLVVTLPIAFGNTLEAVIAAQLLGVVGFRKSLDRVQDALSLIAVAAVVSPAASALIGVNSAWLAGVLPEEQYGSALLTWWLGDAMGSLIVAPVLLTWRSAPRLGGLLARPREALALLTGLLLAALIVFEQRFFGGNSGAYAMFPFIIWGALRFGPPGAAGATMVVSLIATQSTARESGPFATANAAQNLLALQSFMAVLASSGMVLAAAISERRRAEAEVQQLNGVLQHLNAVLEERVVERTAGLEATTRELEAFTSAVAHDLRAPLRHLDGFANLLLVRAESFDETSRRHLQSISAAASKLGRLVDDLLAFSRTGRTGLRTERVDVAQLVRELQRELSAENQDRPIQWSVGALPAVQADRALLRTALANLLSNAIKFSMPRDQSIIEIGVENDDQAPPGQAVLFVRDNGIGFDPQYGDKLFRVFERLHTDGEFDGTGIGLATVRRVVERHGGRVWAQSDARNGATFYMTLPLAR
ncbi:MAG TPA: MASE1 domain-containing protein [Candidatus Limnocylindrales bacterium]|nr:MASE1 domain-containing protein [Candidatus Limnocylindrales bacterium]